MTPDDDGRLAGAWLTCGLVIALCAIAFILGVAIGRAA